MRRDLIALAILVSLLGGAAFTWVPVALDSRTYAVEFASGGVELGDWYRRDDYPVRYDWTWHRFEWGTAGA